MKEGPDKNAAPAAGDGLRSVRTTSIFKALNFELYVKPNKAIMAAGIVALIGALGYIAYMKKKYEGMGYYSAISEDGTEQYRIKRSKWD